MAFLCTAFIFFGCGKTVGSSDEVRNEIPVVTEIPTETSTEPAEHEKRVHVSATGDNLIHYSVVKNARKLAQGNQKYNFVPLYENVRYIIESADIAVINQETIISESNKVMGGNDGSLLFNSPPEVADAVIDLGFDVITMANNHVLDFGTEGLEESINFWNKKADENNLTVLGAYLNKEDSENIRIREVNGIKIAFLAYTQHLNGFEIPDDSDITVIQTSDTETIFRQIEKADSLADFVIVSMHWGVEDTHEVTEDRHNFAVQLVNSGADVILGCHPHTAQSMEWIERNDGSKGFVYYSMGNFICTQTDNFNLIGEIPDFDIVMNDDSETVLENVGCIPIIIHYESPYFANLRVYPYSKYSPELAEIHGLPDAEPRGNYTDFSWETINSIINENIPEEFRFLQK